MAKTVKIRVSNPTPITGNPLPGDKCPDLEPALYFYKEGEDYDSDSGDEVVIHIKIVPSIEATNTNIKNLIFTLLKYFDHQGHRVVCVLQNMTVSIFGHLGINNWRGIYLRCIFVEKLMKGPSLTKFSNAVLDCN